MAVRFLLFIFCSLFGLVFRLPLRPSENAKAGFLDGLLVLVCQLFELV